MSGVELFEHREYDIISQAVRKYLGIELNNDNISKVNRMATITNGKNQYQLSYDDTYLGVIKYDISKENCNIVFEPNNQNNERELSWI